MKTKKCVNCNREILLSDKYCIYCGSNVVNTTKCLICDNTIYKNDKYCIYCGKEQSIYTKCNICNKTVLLSDKYCIYCGSNIANIKKCIICDKTIYKNDKYCIYCGKNQSLFNVCKLCNNVIYSSDKYCIYCGNKQTYKKIDYQTIVENRDDNNEDAIRKEDYDKVDNETIDENFESNDETIGENEEILETKKRSKVIPILIALIALIIATYFIFFRRYNINYYNVNGVVNNNPTSYMRIDEYTKIENLKKDGYIFDGWYSDSQYKNKISAILGGSTGDIDLFAKWEIIEYTITYNLDGGVNSYLNPAQYTVESERIELKEPTKDGYEFEGWYRNNDKVIYIEKGSIGNIELKAKWSAQENIINYYLTFGANNPNPTKIAVDSEIYLQSLDNIRAGYLFEGWSSDYDTNVYKIKGNGNNINLYANWKEIEYSISYLNAYENDYNPSKYTINSEFWFSDPYRNGYDFEGWYENGIRIRNINIGTTGNKTLEARWACSDFSINYQNTNGQYNPNPTIYNADSGYINLINLDDIPNYHFDGWYDVYGNRIIQLYAPNNGSIVLYAEWSYHE